jgi:hypothetical protein
MLPIARRFVERRIVLLEDFHAFTVLSNPPPGYETTFP